MEGAAKLIEAIAKLIGAFAPWGVLGLIVWWFRDPIRSWITGVTEFKLKGPGFEASGTKIAEAAIPLAFAELKNKDKAAYNDFLKSQIELSVSESFSAIERLAPRMLGGVYGRGVLWVDDMPTNNNYEQRSLEALGLIVSTAPSTAMALKFLQSNNFDVVISDMGRPEGNQAGFELLVEMQKRGYSMPTIFYTSEASASQFRDAVARGAYGITSRPRELIQLVVAALH